MQEAESILLRQRRGAPVRQRALEQRQRADHIRLHERRRAIDRTVDVRFGREIHDRIGLVFVEQFRDEHFVADIALHEDMIRIVAHRLERIEIARVREQVEIDDAIAAFAQKAEHEIAADKPGAAGDQKGFH